MKENTVLVNGYEVSGSVVKEIDKRLKRVDAKVTTISRGYLTICGDVAYLRDNKAHLVTGHKNLYDLCMARFGMARGTVSNLTQIYDKWGSDYKLPDDISSRKITELLAELKETKKLENPDAGEDPDSDSDNEYVVGDLSPHAAYSFEVNSFDWSMADIVEEMLKDFQNGAVKGFPERLLTGDKITLTIN